MKIRYLIIAFLCSATFEARASEDAFDDGETLSPSSYSALKKFETQYYSKASRHHKKRHSPHSPKEKLETDGAAVHDAVVSSPSKDIA